MKPPELTFDRDLLGDIKTRVRHPRPADGVRFQSAIRTLEMLQARLVRVRCASRELAPLSLRRGSQWFR